MKIVPLFEQTDKIISSVHVKMPRIVSIDDQTVVSDKGVVGDGPGGSTLKADRMNAFNGDGRLVIEGNVAMRLYPAAANDDNPPEDDLASEGNNQ